MTGLRSRRRGVPPPLDTNMKYATQVAVWVPPTSPYLDGEYSFIREDLNENDLKTFTYDNEPYRNVRKISPEQVYVEWLNLMNYEHDEIAKEAMKVETEQEHLQSNIIHLKRPAPQYSTYTAAKLSKDAGNSARAANAVHSQLQPETVYRIVKPASDSAFHHVLRPDEFNVMTNPFYQNEREELELWPRVVPPNVTVEENTMDVNERTNVEIYDSKENEDEENSPDEFNTFFYHMPKDIQQTLSEM